MAQFLKVHEADNVLVALSDLPVVAVLDYPEYATAPGLNLLCTPGNGVGSTTGMAGAGAIVILFSTGLGMPTGNPVVPVVKISSNTDLALRLPDLIDLDAGPIITGEKSLPKQEKNCSNWLFRSLVTRLCLGRCNSGSTILSPGNVAFRSNSLDPSYATRSL